MLTRIGFFCYFYHALTLSFFLIKLYDFFPLASIFFLHIIRYYNFFVNLVYLVLIFFYNIIN